METKIEVAEDQYEKKTTTELKNTEKMKEFIDDWNSSSTTSNLVSKIVEKLKELVTNMFKKVYLVDPNLVDLVQWRCHHQKTSHCSAMHVDQDTGNGEASLEDCLPNHFQPEHPDEVKNLKGRKIFLIASYVTRGKDAHSWSPKIPSRKRSRVVHKKITPMKRFQKQLIDMWKNYGNPNESSPEEVLLFNNVNNFIPSNEIGLGGVLLKPDDTSA
ncbi:hypothetical protein E2542_SST17272 [Spatholobus suberectus]|nr:hypothetical protein E2542_SST17272 [Spatholobus suberectus]